MLCRSVCIHAVYVCLCCLAVYGFVRPYGALSGEHTTHLALLLALVLSPSVLPLFPVHPTLPVVLSVFSSSLSFVLPSCLIPHLVSLVVAFSLHFSYLCFILNIVKRSLPITNTNTKMSYCYRPSQSSNYWSDFFFFLTNYVSHQ